MDDIDDLMTSSNDAIGGSPMDTVAPIAEGGTNQPLPDQIRNDMEDVVMLINRIIEKLRSAAQEKPTVEVYLQLSDTYLALGTLTKDKEMLRKAVNAAEEVIKIKQRENFVVDNAEQNRRAAADRLGESTGAYSSYSTGYSSYSATSSDSSWTGGLKEAADMFNIKPDE